MEIRNSTDVLLLQIMLVILACFALSINAVESDVYCLRSIKHSLEDPEQHLSSWDFSSKTDGSICRFTGVYCWNTVESRVTGLRLSGRGLIGPFPMGVINCTSLQSLDLSNNQLTGQLPTDVADFIPYMVLLDLSNNNLSGPIPPSLGNFTFINFLILNNNQLTGQIPIELTLLHRLNELNVANNSLSGRVPKFQSDLISAESFAHNEGLCGAPLSPCRNHIDPFFSGFAVGLPVSTIITILIMFCCLPGLSMSNIRQCYLLMIKKIDERKHHAPIPRISRTNNTQKSKMTDMDKYIRPMSLVELKRATNDFDRKSIIGHGNMGLMYKGVFPNGLVLAVKRFHKFDSFEKEFSQEIEILGRLRHVNLVPLLSFCCEMETKFLVYKYISNGTLHQWLHSKPQVEGKKMGWRLRFWIALRIARGLAWLHHNNTLRVSHLKINSNCILLDENFEPKISNFGNSNILMSSNSTLSSGCTFVVPHSSHKEDVYSFGILLLELVSGRERPSAETHTDSSRDDICGEELSMIDECLMGQGFDEEIDETLRIAENCVQTHKDGTTSMLQVYQAIRAIGISRNEISVDLFVDLEGHEGDV